MGIIIILVFSLAVIVITALMSCDESDELESLIAYREHLEEQHSEYIRKISKTTDELADVNAEIKTLSIDSKSNR